jgi:hypothetical protein
VLSEQVGIELALIGLLEFDFVQAFEISGSRQRNFGQSAPKVRVREMLNQPGVAERAHFETVQRGHDNCRDRTGNRKPAHKPGGRLFPVPPPRDSGKDRKNYQQHERG